MSLIVIAQGLTSSQVRNALGHVFFALKGQIPKTFFGRSSRAG